MMGSDSLAAFLRECQGLLIGAVGDTDALQADGKTRLVHHREHALHATIFLADQVADGAAMVAHGHGAGGSGVHAELVFDAADIDVVARAERAVGIDHEFRNQEQRNALGAGRRIRKARQHEMNDVIAHVVIAIGDEDFRALDAIGAVVGAFGAGAQCADIGSRLRFGELHGAGPIAGDEFFEIGFLQFLAAVGLQRLDRAQGQERAEAERYVGGAPYLGAGRVDGERQALAAEILRPRHRVPPAGGPALVGIGPTGSGDDIRAFELDAVFVAGAVERCQHIRGKPAGFFQHGGSDIAVEIAVVTGLHGGLQPGAMVEGQQHVVDRRAVGHGINASHTKKTRTVFPRNGTPLNSLIGGRCDKRREAASTAREMPAGAVAVRRRPGASFNRILSVKPVEMGGRAL
jgi:hypothetical protein